MKSSSETTFEKRSKAVKRNSLILKFILGAFFIWFIIAVFSPINHLIAFIVWMALIFIGGITMMICAMALCPNCHGLFFKDKKWETIPLFSGACGNCGWKLKDRRES